MRRRPTAALRRPRMAHALHPPANARSIPMRDKPYRVGHFIAKVCARSPKYHVRGLARHTAAQGKEQNSCRIGWLVQNRSQEGAREACPRASRGERGRSPHGYAAEELCEERNAGVDRVRGPERRDQGMRQPKPSRGIHSADPGSRVSIARLSTNRRSANFGSDCAGSPKNSMNRSQGCAPNAFVGIDGLCPRCRTDSSRRSTSAGTSRSRLQIAYAHEVAPASASAKTCRS